MLIEAFRMLYSFAPVSTYKYIGFGSTTFVDFNMVHRSLGITDLTSIEKSTDDRRFKFNAPYGCVTIAFDMSNRVLPKLNWDTPCIVWLDYDGALNGSVLTDMRIVAESAVPGSMLIVTVNAEPREKQPVNEDDSEESELSNTKMSEVDALKQSIGSALVPVLAPRDFANWGKARVYRDIMNTQIKSMLIEAKSSGRLAFPDKKSEQIINFHYSDGAKMMTLGWLLHDNDARADTTLKALKTLEFLRAEGEKEFLIELPPLSTREIMHMEQQLPNDPANVQCPGLQPIEIANYCRVYKYYPTYLESELR
ncbi:MAG: hypothetical protein EOO61_03585 [Hymenobacter sp.]|nr:MAG: hypothetical protein EOO61_03585 [Hymenobacter sp.]